MTAATRLSNNESTDSGSVVLLGELRDRMIGKLLRLAMRELVSGVCVVTAGVGNARCGLTASSVTSLALAPPSILVCVQKTARSLPEILANEVFAVNVLSAEQQTIANDFANCGPRKDLARFEGPDWVRGELGVPVLTNALAALECRVGKIVDWHSHLVVFGLVQGVHLGGQGSFLAYWHGKYCQLAAAETESEQP